MGRCKHADNDESNSSGGGDKVTISEREASVYFLPEKGNEKEEKGGSKKVSRVCERS